MTMNKQTVFAGSIVLLFIAGIFILGDFPKQSSEQQDHGVGSVTNTALAAEFEELSKNGNSSCSGQFKESIMSMPDEAQLKGSCCSPMNIHRYTEQVEGLKKFKSLAGQNIAEIPDDPYNINVELAKKLISYYDIELTPEEQQVYDYAMANSNEKGPCCCKCWRWYVYGGLAKFLIQNYGFTGEQITELWNLSDGCGGEGDHTSHS